MDYKINMGLPHLKNVIYANILDDQNYYAEFKFGISDQFAINVTEYIFSRMYKSDAVDVVIAATADAIRMQINIIHNVKEKVAVIPYCPAINGHSRTTVTLLYMQKPCHNSLDDHYDTIVDITPEDIFQQYEDVAEGSDVSSHPEVCGSHYAHLEEYEQDYSSGKMGHAPAQKYLL